MKSEKPSQIAYSDEQVDQYPLLSLDYPAHLSLSARTRIPRVSRRGTVRERRPERRCEKGGTLYPAGILPNYQHQPKT